MAHDRDKAATEVLEDLGWTYFDGVWKAPTDSRGNTAFMIADLMASQLFVRLGVVTDYAATDAIWFVEAEQVSRMLQSWMQVRPPDRFCVAPEIAETLDAVEKSPPTAFPMIRRVVFGRG